MFPAPALGRDGVAVELVVVDALVRDLGRERVLHQPELLPAEGARAAGEVVGGARAAVTLHAAHDDGRAPELYRAVAREGGLAVVGVDLREHLGQLMPQARAR